jgi:hypothetical protein
VIPADVAVEAGGYWASSIALRVLVAISSPLPELPK